MKKIVIALPILLISSAVPITSANTRLCEITGIHDGDSLRVSCHQKALRLACIDAPEPDQPFGQEATDYLASLTLGKELEIVNRGDGGLIMGASHLGMSINTQKAGAIEISTSQTENRGNILSFPACS